ncbi:hypothetical protein GCM10009680_53660 [Streptomyces yatensis]|uniref:Uncharacterized protein n=1 Tax=Streptomyces yatensis TaxID=155177 RepID=A0ABN2IJG2_9ACTN
MVAAGAGAAVGLGLDVADVARAARRTAVDLTADDDPAADTGADLHAEEVLDGTGDSGMLLPHRHEVHIVVDHHRAAQFLAERLPYGEAVPPRHDRRCHRHALGEPHGAGHSYARPVESLGHPGGPELRGHVQHLLEDRDGSLAHIHGLVEMAENLQFGIGHGDVHGGGADVDAEQPQPGREPDVVRAPATARGREPVRGHQPGLQQPVDLHGQLRTREVDLIAQLSAGVGAAVAQQAEQSRLMRVRRSCRHAPHAAPPAVIGIHVTGLSRGT